MIVGANIDGGLILAGINLGFRFNLLGCAIRDGIDLEDAQVQTLDLSGSHCGSIDAVGLISSGNIYLSNGFYAKGIVVLNNASIRRHLICRGGSFENVGGYGFSFDGASIGGGVFLDQGFHAQGEVRLLAASINGDLFCSGGSFENAEGDALSCDSASMGRVFLNNDFRAGGKVRLLQQRA